MFTRAIAIFAQFAGNPDKYARSLVNESDEGMGETLFVAAVLAAIVILLVALSPRAKRGRF